jgi:hypothetical protein
MASNAIGMSATRPEPRGRGLLVLVIGLPILLASFLILAIDQGDDFLMFGIMGIVFLSLAAVFIVSNGSLNAQWCTAPSFMTLTSALQFVAIPLQRFIVGYDHVDANYLKAMALLLIGFSVFWSVCLLLKKPYRFEFFPEFGNSVPRIHFAAIVLMILGALASLVLWRLGILSYGSPK